MNNFAWHKILLFWAFSAVLIFLQSGILSAQELNVSVRVDESRLSSSSLDHLDNLAGDIESYMNEFNWIEPNFGDNEKVDVSLQISLLGVDANFNFEASVVIRSQRPIYNSLQQSPAFLYNDENWIFDYKPNRSMVHDFLQFDRLTTFLDFYAYIILGYDFDSFSELGGTPYFGEAQNLVSLAQGSGSSGWSRTSSTRRNRAQLISDLLNPNYQEFREACYVYHRLGLDQFLDNPQEARQQVLESLRMIQKVAQSTTNNLLFNTFFDAKYRELVNIFEDASSDVRLEAYNILSQVDQSHLREYNKLQ